MSQVGDALCDGLPNKIREATQHWEIKVQENNDIWITPAGSDSLPLKLHRVLESWPAEPIALAKEIDRLATAIRDDQYGTVRDFLPAMLAQLTAEAKLSPGEAWKAAARVVEGGLRAIISTSLAGDLDAALMLPLVRRARFLLLSAPGREDGLPTGAVFNGIDRLAARARQAREEWALDLLNHEEHPLLRDWPGQRLDTELRRLVFVCGAPRLRGQRPLVLPSQSSANESNSFCAWVAREGFLPRFMLAEAWAMLWRQVGRYAIWIGLPLVLAGIAPLAGLVWLFGGFRQGGIWLLGPAAGLAAAAYAALVWMTIRWRDAATLWCLRLPAGAAIGQAALVALDDKWAHPHGGGWLVAAVALAGAAFGYLALEARAHGAPPGWRVVGRASCVFALGFAHAAAVAALVLTVVAPAMKPTLYDTVRHLSIGGAAEVLMLAAAAGLASGVFLQVLWDDRPVTYPLTHLPWRGRAR